MEAAVAAARERAARLAQAHTSTTKDSGADRSQRDRDDGGDRSATGERERERESLRETERGPSSAVVVSRVRQCDAGRSAFVGRYRHFCTSLCVVFCAPLKRCSQSDVTTPFAARAEPGFCCYLPRLCFPFVAEYRRTDIES